MRKYTYYFLVLVALIVAFWEIPAHNKYQMTETFDGYVNTVFPCSKPIRYSIGSIDPKFGLSESKLLDVAKQAEAVWEDPTQKNLFEYDPNSSFKINLIFDERQARTNDAAQLSNNLDILKKTHGEIVDQYDTLNSTYEKKVAQFNADVADYQKRLDKYNQDVTYWNGRGGATKDEYDTLKKEKKTLDDMYNQLENQRSAINQLAGKTNSLVAKENQVVNQYNSSVSTYRDKYGASQEFEKGVYDGKAINIYQFEQEADLRLTLVHEFGHSLGIEHLNQPESIMYYLMADQNMDNPKLSDEDLGALKAVCRMK